MRGESDDIELSEPAMPIAIKHMPMPFDQPCMAYLFTETPQFVRVKMIGE